jgi:shikimate kinase
VDDIVNLILYGFKHSGKSILGKYVADLIGIECVDLDFVTSETYQSQGGLEIAAPDIYYNIGETAFREIEAEAVFSLTKVRDSIIVASSGSVLVPDNVKVYKSLGKMLYLNVSKEVLCERELEFREIGFVTPGELKSNFDLIHEQREKVYTAIADMEVVIAGKDAEDVANEIVECWKKIQ